MIIAETTQLAQAVDRAAAAQHVTGGIIAVARDGKIVYVHPFGLRDERSKTPVDEGTRFEIGSVTKQFTAAAILQLKERGLLHLDDKLSRYVPSFPHASEVTLRQLLDQTSGLPDYLATIGDGSALTGPGGLARIEQHASGPLRFAPGSRFEYSNTNYFALGAVVAKAGNMRYEDYVRKHLFAPAGMTHSAFVDDETKLADMSLGYWQGWNGDEPMHEAPPIRNDWAGGAGMIVSTVGDMLAWDAALSGGKIVSANDYIAMTTPPALSGDAKTNYAFGVISDRVASHRRIWHNGGSNGMFTQNEIYPDDHITIVAFENTAGGRPEALTHAAFSALYPDVTVAEQQAEPGEDLAFRPRMMHLVDEVMHGTLQSSELTKEFAEAATPQTQKSLSAGLLPLGTPAAYIFKGKREDAGKTRYEYRVTFPTGALHFVFLIDKASDLVAGVGVRPE